MTLHRLQLTRSSKHVRPKVTSRVARAPYRALDTGDLLNLLERPYRSHISLSEHLWPIRPSRLEIAPTLLCVRLVEEHVESARDVQVTFDLFLFDDSGVDLQRAFFKLHQRVGDVLPMFRFQRIVSDKRDGFAVTSYFFSAGVYESERVYAPFLAVALPQPTSASSMTTLCFIPEAMASSSKR